MNQTGPRTDIVHMPTMFNVKAEVFDGLEYAVVVRLGNQLIDVVRCKNENEALTVAAARDPELWGKLFD